MCINNKKRKNLAIRLYAHARGFVFNLRLATDMFFKYTVEPPLMDPPTSVQPLYKGHLAQTEKYIGLVLKQPLTKGPFGF